MILDFPMVMCVVPSMLDLKYVHSKREGASSATAPTTLGAWHSIRPDKCASQIEPFLSLFMSRQYPARYEADFCLKRFNASAPSANNSVVIAPTSIS